MVENWYKLSIIITYYQTYDLTIKLLEELQQQKNDEVEMILIDDGCNETRFDKYTFLNIIHLPENGGASHALNTGLDNAHGKYIAFIDSDDMISHDYVSVLLETIGRRNEEEIMFGWENMTTGDKYFVPHNIAIWKAIYRADFCPRFNDEWRFRTDVPFSRQIRKTKHTKYLIRNKILYYYNSNREGSLTWRRLHEERI